MLRMRARGEARTPEPGLDALYDSERERWANAPYAKEDIAREFTEAHLASLSLEEYALLMRRFPSEMVTHVVRQGVRDHAGMVYHTAGMGEFADGFERMLEDRRLKSPLAVRLAEAQKQDDLMRVITRPTMGGEAVPPKDREEALQRLAATVERIHDPNAVHFSVEAVTDAFYGSEAGNEIFVAYPSAFIASQYHFGNGALRDKGAPGMHNDLYVWDAEQKGMSLDAGIVFIPKDARVDPRTGSRYELGPDRSPKEHPSAEALRAWAGEDGFPETADRIKAATEKLTKDLPLPDRWDALLAGDASSDERPSPREAEAMRALAPIRDDLMRRGIEDPRIIRDALTYRSAGSLASAREKGARTGDGEWLASEAHAVLERAGVPYEEAKETVSSEEFWERRFAGKPGSRPSKVVYYEGGDPTAALFRFREQHGLAKRADDDDLGFSERRVSDDSAEARSGAERFESMMRAAIDARFPPEEGA